MSEGVSIPPGFKNKGYEAQFAKAKQLRDKHKTRDLMLEIDAGEAKARIIDLSNKGVTLNDPDKVSPLEMDVVLPQKNLYLTKTQADGSVNKENSGFIDSIAFFPKSQNPGNYKGWDPMAVAVNLFPTSGAKNAAGQDVGSTYNDGAIVKGVPYSAMHGWRNPESLKPALEVQAQGGTGASNDCIRATNNPLAFLMGLLLQPGRSRFRVVHNRFKVIPNKDAQSGSTTDKIRLRSNPYRPYANVFEIDETKTAPKPLTLPKWDLTKLKTWLRAKLNPSAGKTVTLNDQALKQVLNSKRNETIEVGEVKDTHAGK